MKVYIVEMNDVLQKDVFTTLKGACEFSGAPYSTFSRRKSTDHTHVFSTGEVVRIITGELHKVKGRENNHKNRLKK